MRPNAAFRQGLRPCQLASVLNAEGPEHGEETAGCCITSGEGGEHETNRDLLIKER